MYRVVFLQKSVIYCLTGSKDRKQYHCFFSLHQAMKVCEPDIQKSDDPSIDHGYVLASYPTRDQPMPGPFPAPPIFLREKPWGRGCLSIRKLRTKEVGKEKLLIFLLLMNPCASSPVTRVSRSSLCENRRA